MTENEASEKMDLRLVSELHDTINLMESKDYKERFVAEYLQVRIRRDKLHKMLVKLQAGTLGFQPSCSYEILKHQEDVMNEYLLTLELRAQVEKIELD